MVSIAVTSPKSVRMVQTHEDNIFLRHSKAVTYKIQDYGERFFFLRWIKSDDGPSARGRLGLPTAELHLGSPFSVLDPADKHNMNGDAHRGQNPRLVSEHSSDYFSELEFKFTRSQCLSSINNQILLSRNALRNLEVVSRDNAWRGRTRQS